MWLLLLAGLACVAGCATGAGKGGSHDSPYYYGEDAYIYYTPEEYGVSPEHQGEDQRHEEGERPYNKEKNGIGGGANGDLGSGHEAGGAKMGGEGGQGGEHP